MPETEAYRQFLENHKNYLYRLELNTYVVKSMRLIYMDTPKTGGTSIKTRLAELEAGYHQPEVSDSLETAPEMFIHDRAVNPLEPITSYSPEEQQEMLFSNNWKRICVVRNPYDRLFSAWFSKLLLRQPGFEKQVPGYQLPKKINVSQDIYPLFDEFVQYLVTHGCASDPHWDVQTRLLFYGDIPWTRILRFEDLQQDLETNRDLFGGEGIVLERLNVSGLSADWNQVSPRTLESIQMLYQDDFHHFGYAIMTPPNSPPSDLTVTYVNAVSARNDRLSRLIEQNQQARLTIHDLEARLREVEAQLHGVVSSNSWRYTRPMRSALNLVRRIAKPN